MSMLHPISRPHRRRGAFTLVELLVVIGIIAILISILLPALNRVRKQSQSLKCLSNLRQLGTAFHMYASANKQYLPYTTTTLIINESTPQGYIWFNALDPYLMSARSKDAETRDRGTGVASVRSYRAYKQCPVYELFEGSRTTVGQNNVQEFAKTYKMNSHLRRVPRSQTAPSTSYDGRGSQAKITDVKRSAEFVMVGDGVSLDQTGQIPGQAESGQFSMEVNDIKQACPALRHMGGANILFVDGHAANVFIKNVITRPLVMAPVTSTAKVQSWESEYVNGAGTPVDPASIYLPMSQQGLSRNPDMPLIWSELGKLHRW